MSITRVVQSKWGFALLILTLVLFANGQSEVVHTLLCLLYTSPSPRDS